MSEPGKIKLREVTNYPRKVYEGRGTEYLEMPESDQPQAGKRFYEIIKEDGGTIGAVVLDSPQQTIWNFFLVPSERGKGAGRAAFEAILAKARHLHWHMAQFMVDGRNERMIRFAKKAGWKQSGEPLVFGEHGFQGRLRVLVPFSRKFPVGLDRKPSRFRKWKPVARFAYTKFSKPPQRTLKGILDKEYDGSATLRVDLPTFKKADETAGFFSTGYEESPAPRSIFELMNEFAHGTDFQSLGGRIEDFERQTKYDFRENEIRRAMKRILGVREHEVGRDPLVVFAGFTGQFSDVLKKNGFKVIFSDALRQYADARKDSMQTMTTYSHRIPKVENAEAYVSFEPIPALVDAHGFITYLKALAETKKGMVIVSHYDSPRNPTEGGLIMLSEAYGLGLKDLRTSNLLFTRVFANEKARKKIQLDLEVLKHIEDVPSVKKGGEEYREVPLNRLATISFWTGASIKEIERSLRRLQSTWMQGKVFRGNIRFTSATRQQ
ncbi:MAG: GNAT family N-acetyltransferase [Candidatus Micrarchaeota archaeon]